MRNVRRATRPKLPEMRLISEPISVFDFIDVFRLEVVFERSLKVGQRRDRGLVLRFYGFSRVGRGPFITNAL